MKKFDSVYFLELRLVIYRFLLLALVMTATFLGLYFTIGLRYVGYGLERIFLMCGYAKVAWIFFGVCAAMLLISRVVDFDKSHYRYALFSLKPKTIGWIEYLVTYTILLLWYAVVILDFILVAWLFTKHPEYAGGPNGILCSFSVTAMIQILIPVGKPIFFLRNAGILAVAALLINIPGFINMKKLSREGKVNEK